MGDCMNRRCPNVAEIERLTALLDSEMESNHRLAAKELELTAEVEQRDEVIANVIGWLYAWEDRIDGNAELRLKEILAPENITAADKQKLHTYPSQAGKTELEHAIEVARYYEGQNDGSAIGCALASAIFWLEKLSADKGQES